MSSYFEFLDSVIGKNNYKLNISLSPFDEFSNEFFCHHRDFYLTLMLNDTLKFMRNSIAQKVIYATVADSIIPEYFAVIFTSEEEAKKHFSFFSDKNKLREYGILDGYMKCMIWELDAKRGAFFLLHDNVIFLIKEYCKSSTKEEILEEEKLLFDLIYCNETPKYKCRVKYQCDGFDIKHF
ncbi:MAG: hypothetical protein JXL97_16070 [Bacteroidales bacterium]|nr:hypothetical protein [Bacteroidales bacterium]